MLWVKQSGEGYWCSEEQAYSIVENERGYQLLFRGLAIGCYSSDKFAKMSAEQHAVGRNQIQSNRNPKQDYEPLENNPMEEVNRLWEDHNPAD